MHHKTQWAISHSTPFVSSLSFPEFITLKGSEPWCWQINQKKWEHDKQRHLLSNADLWSLCKKKSLIFQNLIQNEWTINWCISVNSLSYPFLCSGLGASVPSFVGLSVCHNFLQMCRIFYNWITLTWSFIMLLHYLSRCTPIFFLK